MLLLAALTSVSTCCSDHFGEVSPSSQHDLYSSHTTSLQRLLVGCRIQAFSATGIATLTIYKLAAVRVMVAMSVGVRGLIAEF